MRVRRALVIAITTPVLLAAVGMTAASAATPRKSTIERPIPEPEPKAKSKAAAHRGHDAAEKSADDDAEDEGLLGNFARQLL
ncbi:hypothetical protein AB0L75_04730 [Streptomyces sp. NPDC052101]|uniref:hypothetical protein n=1 Tax=Streptomyces sp. NPDC052101 TaxID=3155763 RepID=UPI003413DD4C